MASYILWQKPYAQCSTTEWMSDGLIFAPFIHSRNDPSVDLERIFQSKDFIQLRQIHQDNGYIYNTRTSQIRRYIEMFEELKAGDQILIPRRSFGKHEDAHRAILCRIVEDSYTFAEHHGMTGMYRRIEIVDPHAPLVRVARRSMESCAF